MKTFKLNLLIFVKLMILISVFTGTASCACPLQDDRETSSVERLKIMNWNLQTFFDSNFDGNEYSEYKNSKSGWSREKYEARLDRLVKVIRQLDADLVIMEEVEKEEQLLDITNRLSGTFNFSKSYKYGCYGSQKGNSIGCAIISRFPLEEVSLHSLDIRSLEEEQPAMRPIIQFNVRVKDKSLTIFVNHWKSKSSGEKESRIWREKQEEQLARLMKKSVYKNHGALACGDFNKDISEFHIKEVSGERENLTLQGKEEIRVYSPWLLADGTFKSPGSYWYKEKWERIDHFFSAGKVTIKDFCAENLGEWADSQGRPLRYKIWNGSGYSDHLPITCRVEF